MKIDRIAGVYDPLSRIVFGNALLNATNCYIDRIPQKSRVLVIGGGTGQILKQLDRPGRELLVDYLELSDVMISASRNHVQGYNQIHFIEANVLEWIPSHNYDVIITPFVLDFFSTDSTISLVTRLSRVLDDSGKWIFTDFIPTSSVIKNGFIKLMYIFFRITTGLRASELPDYTAAFEQGGFTLTNENMFFHGMVAARLYQR